jgi:hypothetical protein
MNKLALVDLVQHQFLVSNPVQLMRLLIVDVKRSVVVVMFLVIIKKVFFLYSRLVIWNSLFVVKIKSDTKQDN